MANITYKLLERRQKMHLKAYGILCALMFLAVSVFSYLKWTEYAQVKVLLNDTDSLTGILTEGVGIANANYSEEKDKSDQLLSSIEEKLDNIFPATDNYTILTRQIDSYEETLAKANNPFEVSHITFQEPVETDDYSILPLRMSIFSSSDNFRKFLHLIETSGALNDEVRLMDITSIRLNFQNIESENSSKPKDYINFTVQINAYFQK